MSDLTGLLDLTAKTRRRTTASNSVGGYGTETWADNLTGIACCIQPLGSREQLNFGQLAAESTHRMYFAGVLDLLPRDLVVVTAGTAPWTGTSSFEVTGAVEGEGGQDEVCSVLLKRHLET